MPKTEAGRRIVAIPEVIIPELRWHLVRFAAEGDDGLLFTSADGMPLSKGRAAGNASGTYRARGRRNAQ
jgi:hypothetical protein